ncbi:MAG: hypothetical protein ACLQDF_03145 [Desulfomonilia bacterium]
MEKMGKDMVCRISPVSIVCQGIYSSSSVGMMKRILMIVCIFGLVSTVCLAVQPELNPTKKIPAKAGTSKEIKGKVEEVVLEDLVNEVRPKITIITGDGQKHTFVIRPTTTIYDPGWNPTTLDKITKGQFVRIKYKINKEGYSVALSIKPSRIGSAPANILQEPNKDIKVELKK